MLCRTHDDGIYDRQRCKQRLRHSGRYDPGLHPSWVLGTVSWVDWIEELLDMVQRGGGAIQLKVSTQGGEP